MWTASFPVQLNQIVVDDFAKLMASKFQISMNRKINFFFLLLIKKVPQGIFIHQEKYTTELLMKYSIDNYSSEKVPMAFSYKIIVVLIKHSVNQKVYRGMIATLLYLTVSSPDIIFATGLHARYQADPKVFHLNAVK